MLLVRELHQLNRRTCLELCHKNEVEREVAQQPDERFILEKSPPYAAIGVGPAWRRFPRAKGGVIRFVSGMREVKGQLAEARGNRCRSYQDLRAQHAFGFNAERGPSKEGVYISGYDRQGSALTVTKVKVDEQVLLQHCQRNEGPVREDRAAVGCEFDFGSPNVKRGSTDNGVHVDERDRLDTPSEPGCTLEERVNVPRERLVGEVGRARQHLASMLYPRLRTADVRDLQRCYSTGSWPVLLDSDASDRSLMRLITKRSKVLSRQTSFRRSSEKRGLIVSSAEGVRFAHTATPLPSTTKGTEKEKSTSVGQV